MTQFTLPRVIIALVVAPLAVVVVWAIKLSLGGPPLLEWLTTDWIFPASAVVAVTYFVFRERSDARSKLALLQKNFGSSFKSFRGSADYP